MERILKFPIYHMNSMENDSIVNLEFSERTRNALLRAGYRTMFDLVDNYEKLGKVKGMGIKGMSEVSKFIAEYSFNRLNAAEKTEFLEYVRDNNPWMFEEEEVAV